MRGTGRNRPTDVTIAAPPLDAMSAAVFLAIAAAAFLLTRLRLSFALPTLLVLDPFDMTRYAGHTTITSFKVGMVGVFCALAVRGALRLPRGRAVRWTSLALAVLIIATAATVHEASVRAAAIREVLKAIEYFALFYIAACVAESDDRSRAATRLGCVAVSALVCLTALSDFWHPKSGLWLDGHAFIRIAGSLEGPNQLAAWLGIVLPVAALSSNAIADTVIGFGFVVLALTLSRGGTLQAFAALIGAALSNGQARKRTIAIAALAFSISLLGFGLASRTATVSEHLLSTSSSLDLGGTGSREILWKSAIGMLRAHPLLGVGAGNFEFNLHAYGAPPHVRTQANSLYLEALADGGLVLGATTIVVAWLPPILLILERKTPFMLAIGIIGCALAAHGFADDVTFYTKVGQCWWLIAGVGAAFPERHDLQSAIADTAA